MVQRLPEAYRLDPADPRAPSQEQWDRMSASARARVVAMLPPIVPQSGRYASHVLGLDLMIDGSKLRFLFGTAPLPEVEELVAKLESMVGGLLARAEDAEKRAADLQVQLVFGLKKGVESLCDVLGIELSAERRDHLDALDAAGLEALLMEIRTERRWP